MVLRSELDNLFVKHWLRRMHCTVNVIAFDSVGDMDVWLERFGPSTLATKDLHRREPVQEPKAAPGPLLVQPFTLPWEAIKEPGERGPQGCVHTLFQADLRVVFSLGRA